MIGLDGARKYTILHNMPVKDVTETIPTVARGGCSVKAYELENVFFATWNVGSQFKYSRLLWQYYFRSTQALIFVVDSNDRERMDEAKEELSEILNDDDLKDAILLVLANKQDLPNAMKTAEMSDKLELYKIRNRKWLIQNASAIRYEGLLEGLIWLSEELA